MTRGIFTLPGPAAPGIGTPAVVEASLKSV